MVKRINKDGIVTSIIRSTKKGPLISFLKQPYYEKSKKIVTEENRP